MKTYDKKLHDRLRHRTGLYCYNDHIGVDSDDIDALLDEIDRLQQFQNQVDEATKRIDTKLDHVAEQNDQLIAQRDYYRDQLDRLQSMNRWHKYPDEKPELAERVLVYMKNNYIVIASMFTDNYESSDFWKNDSGQDISNVVLWRPLPQPPEEQE